MQLSKTILISSLLLIFGYIELEAQQKRPSRTNGQEFKLPKRERPQEVSTDLCPTTTFRSIDGTCNNVSQDKRIEYGATDIALDRIMTPQYGTGDTFNEMSGKEWPSPRLVSNTICSQDTDIVSENNLSSFTFTWGQFLDHDIDLTPEGHVEYEPITLPEDEPLFSFEIPFFRSEVHEGTGTDTYRQQTNLITSWIDGSNVYGSDPDRAAWLRTFVSGKLKSSENNLLPFNTLDGSIDSEIDTLAPSMAGDGGGTQKTFVAGDVRAAEQPGLTSLHTLFMRYHNHICDRLVARGETDDEIIYQKARKEVGAVIQAITYNEFLPSLGIKLGKESRYDSDIKPDISNIFATAAYRLGHTMVTEELLMKDDECQDIGAGSISLLEGFFNSNVLVENNIEPILKGLSIQVQNEVDPFIIDNLRNFLFGDPTAGPVAGLDLASLNIQRGRDHGLPDYNTIKQKYTGRSAKRFNDITRDRKMENALASIYSDVENIDAWVGLLCEDKLRGSVLGPTLHAILSSQFLKLRNADRFFYQHDSSLSRRQRENIDNTKLSDVIKAVTSIENIQDNVFFARDCNRRPPQRRLSTQIPNEEFTLDIFPNPARDFIKLELNSQNLTSITIFDIQGRQVLANENYRSFDEISIAKLNPGTYILKAKLNDQERSATLIKTE